MVTTAELKRAEAAAKKAARPLRILVAMGDDGTWKRYPSIDAATVKARTSYVANVLVLDSTGDEVIGKQTWREGRQVS